MGRISRLQRRPLAGEKAIVSDKQFLKALPKNPYLQSKVLWNDMYGSLQLKLENSYRIIFILSAVIATALIGFVIVAGETKVVPYVTVIHGDEVITLNKSPAESLQGVQPKLALYFAKKFIRSVRAVSADGDVNAANKIGSYFFVTSEATQVIKDFYEKNNPDTIARDSVKDVAITSVLRASAHTLVVRWSEDWRSVRSGKRLRTQKYIAEIVYSYKKPSQNRTILRSNPLGFYITHLSWSQDRSA